jgi:enoyl-CoA hydratase/carnithine racemase
MRAGRRLGHRSACQADCPSFREAKMMTARTLDATRAKDIGLIDLLTPEGAGRESTKRRG